MKIEQISPAKYNYLITLSHDEAYQLYSALLWVNHPGLKEDIRILVEQLKKNLPREL